MELFHFGLAIDHKRRDAGMKVYVLDDKLCTHRTQTAQLEAKSIHRRQNQL
jgi:hypothetical protein